MPYSAPTDMMRAMLKHVAQLEDISQLDAFAEFDMDLVDPILEEANKLARDVIAPTNQEAHRIGAELTADGVKAAPCLKTAYSALAEGGWMALSLPTEYGGQGLPQSISLCFLEMMFSGNMGFGLGPSLTLGAVDAIHLHGTDELKQKFIPKMVSGEWTGAMALTEPQAGSDVGALKTKAEPNGDGSYAITGQKIYITWGDHDLTENIVHLVLARTPGAPEGSKGISLFAMSKYHINDDGSNGARNSFKCIGLEEKMGIHSSPTCVMEYDGATGYLIGEENKGLAAMFVMMNAARLQVGLQGVAVAEAAAQCAIEYAADRSQFKTNIIDMPDVQRMIARMRVLALASRAICYANAAAADMAHFGADEESRAAAKVRENLLTPLSKGWSTDRGCEAASLCVQVHGGMGFMDETLAAQLYRDIRIAPIYEGTNGIQAIDLTGRKLSMDNGAGMAVLLGEIRETAKRAETLGEAPFNRMAARLSAAADTLSDATDWMLAAQRNNDRSRAQAGATAYARMAGDVVGGFYLIRAALDMQTHEAGEAVTPEFVALTAFYAEDILSGVPGQIASITSAADVLTEKAMLLTGRG